MGPFEDNFQRAAGLLPAVHRPAPRRGQAPLPARPGSCSRTSRMRRQGRYTSAVACTLPEPEVSDGLARRYTRDHVAVYPRELVPAALSGGDRWVFSDVSGHPAIIALPRLRRPAPAPWRSPPAQRRLQPAVLRGRRVGPLLHGQRVLASAGYLLVAGGALAVPGLFYRSVVARVR